jgi:hypothetical protein
LAARRSIGVAASTSTGRGSGVAPGGETVGFGDGLGTGSGVSVASGVAVAASGGSPLGVALPAGAAGGAALEDAALEDAIGDREAEGELAGFGDTVDVGVGAGLGQRSLRVPSGAGVSKRTTGLGVAVGWEIACAATGGAKFGLEKNENAAPMLSPTAITPIRIAAVITACGIADGSLCGRRGRGAPSGGVGVSLSISLPCLALRHEPVRI